MGELPDFNNFAVVIFFALLNLGVVILVPILLGILLLILGLIGAFIGPPRQ